MRARIPAALAVLTVAGLAASMPCGLNATASAATSGPMLTGPMLTGPMLTGPMLTGPMLTGTVPRISGREVFKIVAVRRDQLRPRVTASGAFGASGHLVRRTGTAVFPRGRIEIRRHVLRKRWSGPSLRTCRLRVRLTGTFRVIRATGRYRRLRERGRFTTTISITLARTGANSCSATRFVAYRAVTYETGYVT